MLVDTQGLYRTRVQEATSSATVSDQIPTSEQLVTTENLVSNSNPSVSLPDQSVTGHEPKEDENLPSNSNISVSLPDQAATGHEPIADRNPMTNLGLPSPLPLDQASTSQTPVREGRLVLVEPSMRSPVLGGDRLPASPLLESPTNKIPESPDQQVALNLAPEPTQVMTGRQRVMGPSIHDFPESPESTPQVEGSLRQGLEGSLSRNQIPTSRQPVSLRRTRSATSSSVSSVSIMFVLGLPQ
ncbi:hypothetical protein B0J14DRAFT_563895 [Halenospora varia]|nr:hypothetical protein B0J14DRAFT_563895 [Halenospora varia]